MERELVERARRGDEVAFRDLVDAVSDRLFAVAYRVLRERERAEDAVQEALVAAWRDLPRLRDPDRFDAWLHRLLVRTCYREAQKRRRWSMEVRLVRPDATVAEPAGDALAARDELERAFRRLSVEHRCVLVLHHYLGLQPGEIAEALGIPPGTAASRIHYAVRALRAAVEADARVVAPPAGRRTA